MINKNQVLEHYNNIHQLIEKYGLNTELEKKRIDLKNTIDQFTLKLLTIGAFSAGKSALLNNFIGEELLREEQTPETAIATELQFGAIENFEMVSLDGNVKRVAKEEMMHASPEQTLNLRYTLNNESLQPFSQYVFVDMPGFNSNIEQHNRAILQYVNHGNAYLLVIDCEDGGIKASAQDFIDEVHQYEQNLIIVLTKIDKKPPSEVEQIKENIIKQTRYLFEDEVPVITYSKYDEEANGRLIAQIEKLNAQSIFEQSVFPAIESLYIYIEITVRQRMKSLSLDDSTLKKEIHQRQRAKEELKLKLTRERSKLTSKMTGQVLPGILGAIESTLYANSTELASVAMSNQYAFSNRINSLLRPVLLEHTERFTEESYAEFLREINLEEILTDGTTELATEIVEKVRKVTELLEQTKETADNFNKAYKAITGVLAIATTVVAPWLEIIILFLPEIFKLIGIGGQASQVDKVKNAIENDVIPQIVMKLRPVIEESLVEVEEQLIQQLEESMSLALSIEEEALQSALTEQDVSQEQHEAQVTHYKEVLEQLTTAKQSLGSVGETVYVD